MFQRHRRRLTARIEILIAAFGRQFPSDPIRSLDSPDRLHGPPLDYSTYRGKFFLEYPIALNVSPCVIGIVEGG
jgi:hypothetical protein